MLGRLRPVPLDMHPLYPSDIFRLLLHFLIRISQLALLRAVLDAVMKGEGPRDLREDHSVLLIVICPWTKDPRLIY
jgi:hypothetical protein